MKKIAIAGNIASGKTQVENYLVSKGFSVFDSDKISHDLLNEAKIKQEITEYFPSTNINNKIDRKLLGNIVFNDQQKRISLERIIHPQIEIKIKEIFKSSKENIVFISLPLLFETGFDKLFDEIIFISADENLRLERLMARNNLNETEAKKRIKSQLSEDFKKEKSNYIINNNGSIEDLHSQVDVIISKIVAD